MKTVSDIRTSIEAVKANSAWSKGVKVYALELIEDMDGDKEFTGTKESLLNGAENWNQYSWGGCALIYDCDIAERTCTPSELKVTRGGERKPNKSEEWLDVQARALGQAARMVLRAAKHDILF